jgi:hypothetical protein
MAGQNKYIAWPLCLLLMLPLAGQSMHMLVHHHPEHYLDSPSHSKIGPQSESCPVCAYEFTSFTPGPDPDHPAICPIGDGYDPSVIQMANRQFSGAAISPRAPPVTG